MKICVIGGAGYIGSHVVLECLKRGHSVTVFDNLSTGCEDNLFADARFIKGDILDVATLADSLRPGFDAIIHLAAFKAAGESMIVPEKYSTNNITGTLNILNTATSAGIGAIIFSSSAAVYGEPRYVPIDESHPTDPSNFYGYTKLVIEGLLNWYSRLKGIRFAALRYFNAAGYDVDGRISGLERNPANLLPVIMEVASGKREKLLIFGDDYPTPDGTGVRDYVHVSDLARAHVQALEYIETRRTNITINLGSENGLSVKSVLDKSREISGRAIPADIVGRRAGDPAALYASSKKAKEVLGWEATHSDIDTLVASTWKIYSRLK